MAEGWPSAERTQDGSSPTEFLRNAGILKYGRESSRLWQSIPQEPPEECTAKCEFCGEKASPLSPFQTKEEKTEAVFCCAQRQQLCLSCLETCDSGTGRLRSVTRNQLYCQTKEHEDFKLIMDSPNLMRPKPKKTASEDYSTQVSAVTHSRAAKVLRFSCASEHTRWILCHRNTSEMKTNEDAVEKQEQPEEEASVCDHNLTHFGKCYPQAAAGRLLQKFYSNGNKFLTVSQMVLLQVFYPSGCLAVIIAVDDGKGRVCIVFDDAVRSSQRIRAMFLSNGKATCYHTNGNIWLNMHNSGCQCLNEEGARVHQWTWSSPSPLKPVFLSLNKAIGVRVLSRKEIFVSFLASGQQAKFRVGSCSAQVVRKSAGPALLEEEVFLTEAKIRINQVIQTLHQCLKTPSSPHLPKTGPVPRYHAASKKTAELVADAV
ncbi:glutamate-rich protein 6 [Thalassophryne amazonica]|uniref:glutamate-rich protein 6 n=1 Tax=Thalassophryne amazonica TaxID=390379 RepID=UPI0014721DCA|nr:glutamate-rich protein 6 [Thalassophryne amazonica]